MTEAINISDEEQSADPQSQQDQPPNEARGERKGESDTEQTSGAKTEPPA